MATHRIKMVVTHEWTETAVFEFETENVAEIKRFLTAMANACARAEMWCTWYIDDELVVPPDAPYWFAFLE